MRPRRPAAVHAAALAALATGAAAAPTEWRICPEASHIGFEVTVNGVRVEGDLPAFSGEGRFDPDRPGDSRLMLTIDMTQLDVGPAVADHFARSADWFDTERFPEARFRLADMHPAGEGRWRAEGDLRLRDVERAVSAELTLELSGDAARAQGRTVVDRRPFNVGRGVSAAMVTVGDEVTVVFDLRARAARGNVTGADDGAAASCPAPQESGQ